MTREHNPFTVIIVISLWLLISICFFMAGRSSVHIPLAYIEIPSNGKAVNLISHGVQFRICYSEGTHTDIADVTGNMILGPIIGNESAAALEFTPCGEIK